MSPPMPRAKRALKYDLWPASDRRAWDAATEPGDILDPGGAAAHWSPSTRAGVIDACGRYLNWLAAHELLEPELVPADRFVHEMMARYVIDLQGEYASSSVATYAAFLALGVKAMAPDRDWSWMTRLVARLRKIATPARDKHPRLVPSDVLVAFGIELMEQAANLAEKGPWQEAVRYRDGLMIALLAARPHRRRNFCAIEIGRHLVPHGDGYLIRFAATETKNRIAIEQPFPTRLLPYLARYLAHHRALLCSLTGHRNSAHAFRPAGMHLWVSKTGSAMSEQVFYKGLMKLTVAGFGHGVHPHLFRDCAGTSIATRDPAHVGITRNLLGHTTLRTSERYYNHARAVEAGRRYQSRILALRKPAPGRGSERGAGPPKRGT